MDEKMTANLNQKKRRRRWWLWLLLLLLAAVLAALLAWLTLSKPAKPKPSPRSSPSASATPTPTPDPTAAWTKYSDSADKFSLRYPSAWMKRTCVVGAHTSLYLAPTNAALGICNSDFGGQMYVLASDGDQRSSYQLGAGYSDLVNQTVAVAGVSGVRQSGTLTASAEVGPVAGTKVVQYLFYTNSRTYLLFYNQTPSGAVSTNVLPDFELMVNSTFAFTP